MSCWGGLDSRAHFLPQTSKHSTCFRRRWCYSHFRSLFTLHWWHIGARWHLARLGPQSGQNSNTWKQHLAVLIHARNMVFVNWAGCCCTRTKVTSTGVGSWLISGENSILFFSPFARYCSDRSAGRGGPSKSDYLCLSDSQQQKTHTLAHAPSSLGFRIWSLLRFWTYKTCFTLSRPNSLHLYDKKVPVVSLRLSKITKNETCFLSLLLRLLLLSPSFSATRKLARQQTGFPRSPLALQLEGLSIAHKTAKWHSRNLN